MRNLFYFPVTANEIFQAIEQIPSKPMGLYVGCTNGILKQGLINYFQNEERMNELLEQLRIKL